MSATETVKSEASGTGTPTQSSEDRVRALPGGIAVLVVGTLLWMVSGSIGLVGGGVLLVAWTVLPATYAFAVGQIAVVAVTRPEGLSTLDILPLAVIELGLAGVLIGPALRSAQGRRTAAWTLLAGSLLGGVALTSYALWNQEWIAAVSLIGLGCLGAYGLHRYEMVVLGKVPELNEGSTPDEGTDLNDNVGLSADGPDTVEDTDPDSSDKDGERA
jgi:hypothetical protein